MLKWTRAKIGLTRNGRWLETMRGNRNCQVESDIRSCRQFSSFEWCSNSEETRRDETSEIEEEKKTWSTFVDLIVSLWPEQSRQLPCYFVVLFWLSLYNIYFVFKSRQKKNDDIFLLSVTVVDHDIRIIKCAEIMWRDVWTSFHSLKMSFGRWARHKDVQKSALMPNHVDYHKNRRHNKKMRKILFTI